MALENLGTIVIAIIKQMLGKEGFIGTKKDGGYFCIKCSVSLLFY
jgi:hypothetical protein